MNRKTVSNVVVTENLYYHLGNIVVDLYGTEDVTTAVARFFHSRERNQFDVNVDGREAIFGRVEDTNTTGQEVNTFSNTNPYVIPATSLRGEVDYPTSVPVRKIKVTDVVVDETVEFELGTAVVNNDDYPADEGGLIDLFLDTVDTNRVSRAYDLGVDYETAEYI